ncbi:MAG: putative sulfate exporter family transporter [Actinomycetia bacterium]|nr:putative sulfate exporter family transporter [Actinomycetes bacterium]
MTLLGDRRFWAGLVPPLLAGGVSWGVGRVLPVLGGPVVAILLGLLVGQLAGQRPGWSTGVTFCSKKVLQGSIVLLGASMSLVQVAQVGRAGLPVMLGTILLAVGAGLPLARLLKMDHVTGGLVTYGTTICGASAIATMSQVMAAPSSAVAVSIGVIVLYNVLAAVIFPLIGQLVHLDASSFGLWAGTAVNDTSSVVAAATSYDQSLLAAGVVAAGAATGYAVVVKLTRTLMIVPLALFQQWYGRRHHGGDQEPTSWWRLVPTFLVLFVVAATARTVGLIPAGWAPALTLLAHLGTTVAMAAVGMSSSFRQIRDAGWRPLALGGVLWLLVALGSLGLQAATGHFQTLS